MYIGDSTCYQLESDCLKVQSPVQKQQVGWRDGNRINMSSCCCCELHPLRFERIELQQVQHVTTRCIFGHSKKDFKLSQNGLMSPSLARKNMTAFAVVADPEPAQPAAASAATAATRDGAA